MDVYLRQRTDRSAALIVSNLHKDRMTATNVQLVITNTAKRAGMDTTMMYAHVVDTDLQR